MVALLATLAFCLLWLRERSLEQQALFLGLWVLSPCFILYARMARSYTLQAALALVAIRFAQDWLREPGNRWKMARYVLAAVALLYTHYLPGLGVVAGTALLGLWRRQWRQATALAAITLAYVPWVGTLAQTSDVVAHSSPYRLSANAVVEHALKLGYAFVDFNFGETIPLWAMGLAAALLPAIGWALWKAWQGTAHPPALFFLVAAIGYFGAANWLSFPFVGARLLFLLPFYYLFLLRGLDARRWHGAITYAGLLLIAFGGLSSYYRKQDFLNKGYVVDFDEIAQSLRQSSSGEPALVLLDRRISDAGYYLHGPRFPYRVVILGGSGAFERARIELSHHRPALVWYLRYGRDMTAGALHNRLEDEVARDYTIDRHYFVPFSWLDHKAMQWLGQTDRPTHLIEALELRRKPMP